MSFRITGLPSEPFAPLFALSDDELRARNAVRRVADSRPVYPCRISLTDAAPGDEVILVHYEHHAVATPYRGSFAIYVRAGERQYDEVDQIPEQLAKRLLSLRAYDADGMLVTAEVLEGSELRSAIERMLAPESKAEYLHAHYAKPGCYAARITRA